MPLAKMGKCKGDPIRETMNDAQCKEIFTFFSVLIKYSENVTNPNVGKFLDKYREITTGYMKQPGPHIPLAIGKCAWPTCGNEFRYEKNTHQRYCCKSCARLAVLARKKEYKRERKTIAT